MGYRTGSGRWADTRDVVLRASATETDAEWADEAVEIADRASARLVLDVTSVGGTNEVQTLTEDDEISGGTFTITFDGETTEAIDFDATAEDVQAALEALDNIDEGDVVVTGGPIGDEPFTLTFGGQYAGVNVPAVTVDDSDLTGTIVVATDTDGVPPTLKVNVQTAATADAESWTTVGSFAEATAVGSERKVFTGFDRFVRVSGTLADGGGTPSVTFSVSGEFV